MQVLSEGSPIMDSSQPARVLVVAHKTAATKPLLEAVSERARSGPSSFTLLVPKPAHGLHRVVDAQDQDQHQDEAHAVLEAALPLLSEAAGGEVEGMIGDPDPLAAVHDAVNLRGFDEIIVSTLSPRLSRWLKLDLPSKLSGLGLPVRTVTPADQHADAHDALSSA
jgi:cell pole-organizing protein PopZ